MLQFLLYLSILIFTLGVLYKLLKLRKRIHLRCELHPIPRSPNGNSYCRFGWWKAIIGFALINRRKMSLQPRHWLATFLFHLGIFTHVLWLFLMVLILEFKLPEGLIKLFSPIGLVGMLLMLVFSLYLLIRKLTPPIRYYVPFEELFILLLVFVFSLFGVLAFFEVDHRHLSEIFEALLNFSNLPRLGLFEAMHITAFSFLILILPFTRVTHYIAVFFAHLVLWDNRPANELEPELTKILKDSRVKWPAHSDPELSWEEVEKSV